MNTAAQCPRDVAECQLTSLPLRPDNYRCTGCGEDCPLFIATDSGKPRPIQCECCGRLICFDCHYHGWLASGACRGLVVCQPCARTCDARSGVFSHVTRLGGATKTKTETETETNKRSHEPTLPIKTEHRDDDVETKPEPEHKRARKQVVVIDTTTTTHAIVSARNRRARPSAARFMPPLAPEGSPLVMLIHNLVFTVDFGTKVRLEHVVRMMAHRGAELNVRRFCAVITRTHESPQVARPAYLQRLGDLAPEPLALTNKQESVGEAGPFCAPVADIVRVQDLQAPTTRRVRDSRSAILLFANGHGVCTGTRVLSQARLILSNYADMLASIGYADAHVKRINIRNMVGCAQLACRVNREELASKLSIYARYDKTRFPGVTISGHPLIRPCTLLVFESGRVVVTGTTSKACADAALARIHPLLLHFDVNTPPGTPMPVISGDDLAPLDDTAPWTMPVTSTDAYDALGVLFSASMSEINRAYRKGMRRVHPDKHHTVAEGTLTHVALTAATHYTHALFELLGDRTRRLHYNSTGQGTPLSPGQHTRHHDGVLAALFESKQTFGTLEEYLSPSAAAADAATPADASDAAQEAATAAETATTAQVPDLPDEESEDEDEEALPMEDLEEYMAEVLEESDAESDAD